MWEIIHWYFIYLIKPSPMFHSIAMFILYFTSHLHIHPKRLSKKDIVPSIALFCQYCGFYLSPSLEHFAFTPWWVVSIMGFRHRECFILLGGILTGFYLMVHQLNHLHGHILINISHMAHPLKLSLKARSIVHGMCILFCAFEPSAPSLQYKDILAGASCVATAFVYTSPDIMSLAMVFSGPFALSTCILHALEMNWYAFYKNNHFRRVKKSLYFLYPIIIILLVYGVNIFYVFAPIKNVYYLSHTVSDTK